MTSLHVHQHGAPESQRDRINLSGCQQEEPKPALVSPVGWTSCPNLTLCPSPFPLGVSLSHLALGGSHCPPCALPSFEHNPEALMVGGVMRWMIVSQFC